MDYPNTVGIPRDYNRRKNWMVLPKDPDHPEKSVDCVWLYPTSSLSRSVIGEVDPVMKRLAMSNYKKNGPIFAAHCNMYAPYYRQLSAAKLGDFTDEEIFECEEKEPRTDVFAALDCYFERYNNGRPFVLAGHSQGACMIVYILTEYMVLHPEHYDRMAAAYVVGYGMTPEQLAENPHIRPAEGANDVGVLLSWNTEGPENIGQHNFVIRPNAYIINPLNWKTDDTPAAATKENGALADARIDLSRRSIIAETADPKLYAIQNETAAKFGLLGKLKPVKKRIEKMMIPGFGTQSYHGFDYALYADSVSRNLKHRIDVYLKTIELLSARRKD